MVARAIVNVDELSMQQPSSPDRAHLYPVSYPISAATSDGALTQLFGERQTIFCQRERGRNEPLCIDAGKEPRLPEEEPHRIDGVQRPAQSEVRGAGEVRRNHAQLAFRQSCIADEL